MLRTTLTLTALLFAAPALACDTLANQLRWFDDEFAERPIMRAESHEGHILVLLVNPETRSWTTLNVHSARSACIDDFGRKADIVGNK